MWTFFWIHNSSENRTSDLVFVFNIEWKIKRTKVNIVSQWCANRIQEKTMKKEHYICRFFAFILLFCKSVSRRIHALDINIVFLRLVSETCDFSAFLFFWNRMKKIYNFLFFFFFFPIQNKWLLELRNYLWYVRAVGSGIVCSAICF